jgi:tetratricopeptide (TPR) repeat protein
VTTGSLFVPLLASLAFAQAKAAAPARAPATAGASAPAAIAARALALQKEGKLEAAAEEYRRLLAVVPESWEARSNLGVIAAQRGHFDEAVEEYRRALSAMPPALAGQPPSVAVRYNLAVALYKGVRMRAATAELENVLKSKPDHPTAPLLLADCRLQLGEWKQVIAILDPLLEREPENEAILYMLGTALMRDRQYERGQRVIDRILSQGASAEAHLVLALASREANDDIAAEKQLRRALELNPSLVTANGTLGSVLMRMMKEAPPSRRSSAAGHQLTTSVTASAQALPAEAAAPSPWTSCGGRSAARARRALLTPSEIAQGELEAARQRLAALVAEQPAFSEAHVSLAMVYYRLGRRDDGNREQAIVQRLKAEQKAREDAERAKQQGQTPP